MSRPKYLYEKLIVSPIVENKKHPTVMVKFRSLNDFHIWHSRNWFFTVYILLAAWTIKKLKKGKEHLYYTFVEISIFRFYLYRDSFGAFIFIFIRLWILLIRVSTLPPEEYPTVGTAKYRGNCCIRLYCNIISTSTQLHYSLDSINSTRFIYSSYVAERMTKYFQCDITLNRSWSFARQSQ